jgi:hypothetical protein
MSKETGHKTKPCNDNSLERFLFSILDILKMKTL